MLHISHPKLFHRAIVPFKVSGIVAQNLVAAIWSAIDRFSFRSTCGIQKPDFSEKVGFLVEARIQFATMGNRAKIERKIMTSQLKARIDGYRERK
jgi:hypothetical protein